MSAWKLSPLAIALVSAQSFAVQPAGMAMGSGFTLLPNVETSIESNDNIYTQDNDVVSSTITRIAPSFALKGDMGKLELDSSYKLEQGIYDKNSDDDYIDHNLDVAAAYELNSRNQLSVNAIYNVGHDARGSAKGLVLADDVTYAKPDEYNETTAGLSYTFGSASAPFNLDLSAESYQKRYDNNEQATDGREYDKINLETQLSYTVSSATDLLVKLTNSDISYENAAAREGSENTVLVGASWDISGATTGEFKIGLSEREFDDASIETETNLNWEGNLTWQPLTYSTVSVVTSQAGTESAGAGDFIDSSTTSVSWDHEYSNFYSAGFSVSYGEDNYENDPRNDINTGFGVQATYSPQNFLDITASYDYEGRNSNDTLLDSEKNIFSLGVTLAL
jgi:hypothetical protein